MTYVHVIPPAPYDPNEPNSLLGTLECFVVGGFAGFVAWHIHPAIGIGVGIFCLWLYYMALRMLRKNRSNSFVKFLIVLFAIFSGLLYGYIGYRIAKFFAPGDGIWQLAGFGVGAALAFFDRWQLARKL